jgi:hypothetical protein
VTSYPSNNNLSPEELEEFHAPEYLTAQAKLSYLKGTIIEIVCQVRSDKLVKDHEFISDIKMLRRWKSELPLHMTLGFDTRMSLHLKYNQISRHPRSSQKLQISLIHLQCCILILRPLLLKQLANILENDLAHVERPFCHAG